MNEQYFPTKLERSVLIARRLLIDRGIKPFPMRIQDQIFEALNQWYAVSTINGCIWEMKRKGLINEN